MDDDNLALQGTRVLDLSRVLAGPYCGMLLADMGAEVIKIEVPGQGDDSRQFGPFVGGESSYFMNLNRNKKGLTLNLKAPEGRAIFKRLVEKADILIENYRPGTMEKLGLHYEVLSAINPGIIYGSISGFGQRGRYRDRAGYDIIGQAMGGLMSVTGWPTGEPTRTGTAIGDILAGLSAAVGILAAFHRRTITGRGQLVDISLLDCVVSSLEIIIQIYLTTGRIPQRIGNRYESTYPYDSFRAADGSLVIGAGNDKLWAGLCRAMHREDLIHDKRYNDNPKRVQRCAEIRSLIEEWTTQRTVAENVELVLAAGVPASPINTIDKVVDDPHIALDRSMILEMNHPKAGRVRVLGSQIKIGSTPYGVRLPSPMLGEHTREILRELLHLPDGEIDRLARGAVL
jgi:CoA:oxalate CoA-transferase